MLKIRLDKFVWCVRLCKTRSQGTEFISKGQIKLNSQITKPSKEVKLKDLISFHKNNAVFSYKVIELLDKRVGAALIENYILDITPIEEKEKFKAYQLVRQIYRQNGDGKPTKKDRRDIDSFLNVSEWNHNIENSQDFLTKIKPNKKKSLSRVIILILRKK